MKLSSLAICFLIPFTVFAQDDFDEEMEDNDGTVIVEEAEQSKYYIPDENRVNLYEPDLWRIGFEISQFRLNITNDDDSTTSTNESNKLNSYQDIIISGGYKSGLLHAYLFAGIGSQTDGNDNTDSTYQVQSQSLFNSYYVAGIEGGLNTSIIGADFKVASRLSKDSSSTTIEEQSMTSIEGRVNLNIWVESTGFQVYGKAGTMTLNYSSSGTINYSQVGGGLNWFMGKFDKEAKKEIKLNHDVEETILYLDYALNTDTDNNEENDTTVINGGLKIIF